MPYSSGMVANWFLVRAKKNDRKLTHMQIQKLVYIAHGWHLAVADKPLVQEYPEAWKYGPVFSELYRAFKKFGSSPVTEYYTSIIDGKEKSFVPAKSDRVAQEVLKAVWKSYRKYSATQLSAKTHQEGTPWSVIREKSAKYGMVGASIPNDLIREHYLSIVTNASSEGVKSAEI